MTDEEALLRAVMADPDDDAPRLIYADWLDENGQSDRAEFIRLQCELARLSADASRRPSLEDRERRLVTKHWLPALPPQPRDWGFHRGFVYRITYEAADFLRGCEAVFRAAPIRHLRLLSARSFVTELTACPYLVGLHALDLRFNALRDPDIYSLCRCPHLAALTYLDLTGNRLRRAGAHALVTSPYLRSLEILQLASNPSLDPGDQRALRRRFGSRVYF